MPVRNEGGAGQTSWRSLIKADRIREVLNEATRNNTSISGEEALECVVSISHIAYKHCQDGVSPRSTPEDMVQLTTLLCSKVISQPPLCNLRFATSLYHISLFLLKQDHLMYLRKMIKIVVKTKEANINTFLGDGRNIHIHFISLLKKVIPKIVSNEEASFDQLIVQDTFSLFMDVSLIVNSEKNGSTFLESVLALSQIIGKENIKLASTLICSALVRFSDIAMINDVDSSLVLLFKLYSTLFHYQRNLTEYVSALRLILSYVDKLKLKFCDGKLLFSECFYLLSQAKMFIASRSEKSAVKKMVQNANKTLEIFKNIEQKEVFVKETCLLMLYFVNSLKELKTMSSSDLLGNCLEQFLEMMANLYNVLKDFDVDKLYSIYCLSNGFLLISDEGHLRTQEFKNCLKSILKTESLLLELMKTLRSENHPQAESYTKLVLTRCANLVRSCHLTSSLQGEIVEISKPICKFICTLPNYIFDDTQNKTSTEVIFTCLMQALGPQQLYQVLEVAVAWLLVCPQSSDKVFRLWGDVKHNAICAGGSEFLDTTILTIVTEGKSSLEENWLPCNLTPEELGNFLMKELDTYFINRTLRGSPVLKAAEALESMSTDVLTQVRGVVVALDVTSARSEYEEQCRHYYNRSKQLLATLRKQKFRMNRVVYNCIMGELLYARFRFKLKSFRSECDDEVLRLSALHESTVPLVAKLPEEQPDPDDTCDVATSYTNLSLEKQKEVLADLDNAVAHWKVACTHLTKKDESDNMKYDLRIIMKNLQESAFIMKLYCDAVKEGELWRLLYSLAVLVNDKESIVIAVGEMLTTENIDPVALGKAKELLNKPGLSEKTKQTFTLKKALFHLSKNEITEGVNVLKGVDVRKSSSTILYICHNIVLGLYQLLSNWTMFREDFSSNPSCHFSFHKALSNLLYLCQEEKWSSLEEASHIQVNLLEVTYHLGEINWNLEQPREARCYLKSQLSVAQKLGLPLRSAQLLLLLAWVDLNTGVMDDCAVKLEGLEALLNLSGSSARYIAGEDNSKILSKAEVEEPEFLKHCAGCDCFVCRCTEYQRLVLDTLTIRATFCANNNQSFSALQSFKVAIRVQEHLSNVDDKVRISSHRMWKHYADTLVKYQKLHEALDANQKAFDALPSTLKHSILLQHTLHQKSYLQSLTIGRNKPRGHRIVIEIEETTSSIKTPADKRGEAAPVPPKTPLSVVNSNITPKFARPVRKLTLPSSGEENTPPPKCKRRIKLPPKFTIETPKSTNRMPKKISTKFTIAHDDGSAVSVSTSKVSSRVRAKTETKACNIVDPINKKIVGSGISNENESDTPSVFKSPERKSNRKPKVTYERSKAAKDDCSLKKPETSQSTKKREPRTNSKIFSFDVLKQEVSQIEETIPKSSSAESSTKPVASGPETSGDKGSDCSVVSGTPSPPSRWKLTVPNLKPRPVTSDKVSDCSVVSGTPSPPSRWKLTVPNLKPRPVTRSNRI